jgi:hypothetical protein
VHRCLRAAVVDAVIGVHIIEHHHHFIEDLTTFIPATELAGICEQLKHPGEVWENVIRPSVAAILEEHTKEQCCLLVGTVMNPPGVQVLGPSSVYRYLFLPMVSSEVGGSTFALVLDIRERVLWRFSPGSRTRGNAVLQSQSSRFGKLVCELANCTSDWYGVVRMRIWK